MGSVLILILVAGFVYYLYKKDVFGQWRDLERSRAQRESAFRNGHPVPHLAPRPKAPRKMPPRRPGQALVHERVGKKIALMAVGGAAFLLFVGVVGQSLIPVFLMLPALAGIIGLMGGELEKRERILDSELDGALASVGSRDDEWYVPENWL